VLAHPREPAISPPYFAGIIYLLSNNSDLAFTPGGLRELAIPQKLREASSEPSEFQVHRLSARLGAEWIEEIVRRYEAGESARTLAIESGVAPSALLRLLRERNVVVRKQVDTPDQEQLMAQGYEAGMANSGGECNTPSRAGCCRRQYPAFVIAWCCGQQ
jgi:hypothetical protein